MFKWLVWFVAVILMFAIGFAIMASCDAPAWGRVLGGWLLVSMSAPDIDKLR